MNILIDGQTLETEEINRGIGVYFKNVLTNMIRQSVGDIWYITVSSEKSVLKLDRWTVGRLIPIVDRVFAPGTDYEREEAFSDRINQAVAEYRIDRFWCPNPLMVNVLFPNKAVNCPFYATVYDLIPYLMPIAEWEQRITREYHRRLEYLRNVHLICISEATRADMRRIIGEDAKADVTLLAADHKLFYGERQEHVPDGRASVVYTGGFDYRKNMYGAVEAFAEAKKAMPDLDVTFFMVGKYSAENREKMERYLDELGVRDSVHLTGFLPDEELARLYREADVFFFPSFYEDLACHCWKLCWEGLISCPQTTHPCRRCVPDMLCCATQTIRRIWQSIFVRRYGNLFGRTWNLSVPGRSTPGDLPGEKLRQRLCQFWKIQENRNLIHVRKLPWRLPGQSSRLALRTMYTGLCLI